MTKKHLIVSQIIIILASLAIPYLLFVSAGFLALGIGGNPESQASDRQIVDIINFLSPSPNRDAVNCNLPAGLRSQNPDAWAKCDQLTADATKRDLVQNEIRAIYFYIILSLLCYGLLFIFYGRKKVASQDQEISKEK
jgi:hypothetical protein